jgi:Ca-activated chloride channel family protein
MKFSAKLAKEKYDHSKEHETHLMVELEAPKVEWQKSRAPICVIPVLDISGSMAGEKLDYLKKACRKLIDHLAPGDFAGVVAYDSSVFPLAPVTEITQYHKDEIKKKIADLNAGSCTNLAGGLLQGLQWLNGSNLPDNVILRIILFTDGMANVGVSGRALLDFAKEHKGKASISAFGFGNDCDQELLSDLAGANGGNYAFIDSPDTALTSFARELGGLMSTYAQDIRISIKSDKNNEVAEVLNDEDVTVDDGKTVVHLRDILGEEKKWVVARVRMKAVDRALPRKVTAFEVSVLFKDKDGKEQSLKELAVKTRFCKPGEEPTVEDSEVVRQRDRLLAARAQTKAEAFARVGDYSSAQAVLYNCSIKLDCAEVKSVVDNLNVSYSSDNYLTSKGLTNAVRNTFMGRRSYSGGQAAAYCCDAGAQSNSAQNDIIESFASDESGADVTITDAAQPSGNITWVSSPIDTKVVVTNNPISTSNVTVSASKKKSRTDW